MAAIQSRKTDYRTEFISLLREQYKSSPKLSILLNRLGDRVQELEDAAFSIMQSDTNYGVFEGAPLDSLLRTARMFGLVAPEILSEADILAELRGFIASVFSRGLISDLQFLTRFVYNYQSDVTDLSDGVYLTVLGDISSNQGKRARLIHKYAIRIMPATKRLHGIIQGGNGWFGFNGFVPAGGHFRLSTQDEDETQRMAELVIDENGNFIL